VTERVQAQRNSLRYARAYRAVLGGARLWRARSSWRISHRSRFAKRQILREAHLRRRHSGSRGAPTMRYLFSADGTSANLTGADLRGSDMTYANFSSATFTGANWAERRSMAQTLRHTIGYARI